jgi:glucose/arabinose dehydrogenase
MAVIGRWLLRGLAAGLIGWAAGPAVSAQPEPPEEPPDAASFEGSLAGLRLPPGFQIELVTAEVPNARSIARGPNGTLFVSTRTNGSVYAVVDEDGDWRADRVLTLIRGLYSPNGVAVRDDALYIAEINRVIRLDDIENRLDDPPEPVVVSEAFPGKQHHGWKFIRFGPDGRLYVPVGAPCNVCTLEDPFGTIMRMNPDGSGLEVYARGVRNSVGFDFEPSSGELWFTDNGRDLMGGDVPADELNHAPPAGLDFGFPRCHGGDVVDPEFGKEGDCATAVPPARKLGPHVAALGMRFYTGAMFPPEYRDQIFIAEHGSWNRSQPIGYRITLVRRDEAGTATSYETFAEGWLGDDGPWGRPVDLEVMPDGSLLVSDDHAGALYRISYAPP